MSGFAPEEQEAFVDVLLAIKSNLVALNGQAPSGKSTESTPGGERNR